MLSNGSGSYGVGRGRSLLMDKLRKEVLKAHVDAWPASLQQGRIEGWGGSATFMAARGNSGHIQACWILGVVGMKGASATGSRTCCWVVRLARKLICRSVVL